MAVSPWTDTGVLAVQLGSGTAIPPVVSGDCHARLSLAENLTIRMSTWGATLLTR